MERIPSAQPPPYIPKHPTMDISDMHGVDFPMYMYKPRRGMKSRDECKETYKLPHRLIEKKRRDRINECIAQLKDLLPEQLKLTTLGHLEKAVVLELTLKHVKTLNALLEQQQQKIVALQKDLQIGDVAADVAESSEEMFRSGFHLCANEVIHYLATQDGGADLTPSRVIGHIQKVATEVLRQSAAEPEPERAGPQAPEKAEAARSPGAQAKNCVPVIQRTFQPSTGEQSGSDTDTDSGYGGEHDKPKSAWGEKEGEAPCSAAAERIKKEDEEPRAKRARTDSSEDESSSLHVANSGYVGFPPSQPPYCLPFYVLPPAAAAAAAYLPMLEKCWYPGGVPVMYPGLSGHTGNPETLLPHSSSLVMSPRAASPDPAAFHKASKQLNSESKD